MVHTAPARSVSRSRNGKSVWTFTLEGSGAVSQNDLKLGDPIKVAYTPSIDSGICSYDSVDGEYSLADLLLQTSDRSDCVDTISSVLLSKTYCTNTHSNLTCDVEERVKAFINDAQSCKWRRRVLKLLFSESPMDVIGQSFGFAEPYTVAPGLGRFIVGSNRRIGLLLPCGSGFSEGAMVFRLCEELISFKIAGAAVDPYILDTCSSRLKTTIAASENETVYTLMKANLIAHMDRASGKVALSNHEGTALVKWAIVFTHELYSMYEQR